MINISVIIPTFNRKNPLYNTLCQLQRQLCANQEILSRIIVVVDGSIDGTMSMLRNKFSNIYIVEGTGNWWYTKSMNEGFKYEERFRSDYILTMNDDVVLDENYVVNLLQAITKVDRNSIIGSFSYLNSNPPRVFFSGVKNINKISFKQQRYLPTLSIIEPNKLSGLFPSKTLPGRGMLIPSKNLKKMNYFDEKFPQYGSDDDFVLRSWKEGYKAYVSYDAKIISLPEYTSSGAPINKPSFFSFFKNMFFNKYSSLYFFKNFRIYYRHGNKLFLPITIIYQLLASFYSYFKYSVK